MFLGRIFRRLFRTLQEAFCNDKASLWAIKGMCSPTWSFLIWKWNLNLIKYLLTKVYLYSVSSGLNRFTRACIKTLCNRTSSHWNQQLSSTPCDRRLRLEDSRSQSYCSRGAEVIFLLQRRLAEWRGKVSRRRPAVQHVQGLAVSSSACAARPSQLGQHSRLSGQCQVLYSWVQ